MLNLFRLFRTPSVTDNTTRRATATRPSTPQTEEDWASLRRPRLEHESKLSGWTRNWLDALPEHLRPTETSAAYPHIVNRLALSWRDPVATEHVFDDLLVDRREGRKGFPRPVLAELLRLRDYHYRRRDVASQPTVAGGDASLGIRLDAD